MSAFTELNGFSNIIPFGSAVRVDIPHDVHVRVYECAVNQGFSVSRESDRVDCLDAQLSASKSHLQTFLLCMCVCVARARVCLFLSSSCSILLRLFTSTSLFFILNLCLSTCPFPTARNGHSWTGR